MSSSLSNQEIGALRDHGINDILGKRVVLENVRLPATENAQEIILSTRGRAVLLVSQVDVYTHLLEGTSYKKRFDDADRVPGHTFAFPVQGGLPNVSVVLPNQKDAIAVIKSMLSENGEELSWAAVLEQLGVDRSQFRDFIPVIDGIDLTQSNSPIRLEPIVTLPHIDHELVERPKPAIANLDSTLKLRLQRDTRMQLRSLLPELLHDERNQSQQGSTPQGS